MKWQSKKFTSLLLIFTMLAALTLTGCNGIKKGQQGDTGQPEQSFQEFVDELYRDEVGCDTLSLHYTLVHPENYGITLDEVTMGTYSQAENTASIEEVENCITTLKSYSYDSLSEAEQLIYDCLLFTLEANRKLAAYEYYAEPLGPTTGLQAQLPILLAEYHFYTKEDIDTYIKLLPCTLDYFKDIAQYEREKSAAGCFMTDEVADEIIAQCQNFIEHPEQNLLIEYFNNTVESFDGLSKDDITLYEEANRDAVLNYVIPAYQLLIQTLTDLKGTAVNQKGVCGLADGQEYFETLIQYETGSSKSIREMQKLLNSTVKSALISMSAAQMQDPSIYTRYENAKFPTSDPVEGLKYLKDAIQADFPALDDVDYSVKYIHESLQEYLSPAMYLVPPFDDRNNNNIYINQNPEYSMDGIFTTLAHEGYPGHLYQNVYYLGTEPSPIRQLLRTTGYTEGWGTYAEFYGYKLAGYDPKLSEFLLNNHCAILCLYGLSEIGIHWSGWDLDETIAFWADYGIDKDTASEIYLDLISEPGVYLPYIIGYLEFTALRDKASEALGDHFSIREFHTFLLDIGPAPFAVIDSRLEQWISTQK